MSTGGELPHKPYTTYLQFSEVAVLDMDKKLWLGGFDPFVDDSFFGSCWSVEADRHFVLTNGRYCAVVGGGFCWGWLLRIRVVASAHLKRSSSVGRLCGSVQSPVSQMHTFFSTRHRRCLLQNTLVNTMVGSDLNAIEEELLIL
jgi:hypothetical protein